MSQATPSSEGAENALAAARQKGAARLERWRLSLADPLSPVALELAKAGMGAGEIACGRAGESLPVRGPGWTVRFWMLAGLAWVSVLAALLRFPGHGGLPAGRRWVALHAEVSNRTRPLLDALRDGAPADGVLVLGFPRRPLSRLRRDWAPWLGAHALPLARPVSLGTFLASTRRAWRELAGARRLAATCPVSPSARELMAILARLALGEASARWWAAHGHGEQVLYGHTGTADTTCLELAQQARAMITVHHVHGVSGGRNFLGRSNVAVLRCGHDADWHARLGGYGRCEWMPAEPPAWTRGDGGLLLLSSFAHPMYLGYCLQGLAEECALLRAVAEAARLAELKAPMTWLPHPAAALLPEAERESLWTLAEKLGFAMAPSGQGFRELAARSRWVVSSESTVVIELMADGQLPVMWPSPWSDPGAALARYPLRACSAAALAQALLSDDASLRAGHARAWEALRPGLSAAEALRQSATLGPSLGAP